MVGVFIFGMVVLFLMVGLICWGLAIVVSRDNMTYHTKNHWQNGPHL